MNYSLAFLQNIINSVADPIIIKDEQHQWILINHAFSRFIGLPAEELIGQFDHDIFPPIEANISWENDQQAFNTGEIYETREAVIKPSGKVYEVAITRSPYTDEQGHKYLVNTFRNITESAGLGDRVGFVPSEEMIAAIALRIRQSWQIDEILQTTAREVQQFFQADRVVIYQLIPKQGSKLVVEVVAANFPSIEPEALHSTLGMIAYDIFFNRNHPLKDRRQGVLAIDDVQASNLRAPYVEILTQLKIGAFLGIPLLLTTQIGEERQNQLWGWLIVHQGQPRTWQHVEAYLLKKIIAHTAIAMQQSLAYAEALHQKEQAQALYRISQSISSSLDPAIIFATTTKEVAQLLKLEHADIWQYIPGERIWGNLCHYQLSQNSWCQLSLQVSDLEHKIGQRLKQLEIVCINDTNTLTGLSEQEIAQVMPGAWLLLPLQVDNQFWGALSVGTAGESYQWQQQEIKLASQVAGQLAVAIQQSQERERDRILSHLSKVVYSCLDLENVFQTATREISNLLKVDSVDIVQYLPERKLWKPLATYVRNTQIGKAMPLDLEIPDENNQIANQLKQGCSVRIDDTRVFLSSEDSMNQDLALQYPGAWLMAPLSYQGIVWGNLALRMAGHPYNWQDSEVNLVEAIADRLSIAIQQSELLQQTRQQQEREQLLNRVTQAIRSSLELKTIFTTAAREVCHLLNADNSQILQYLPEAQLWSTLVRYDRNLEVIQDMQLEIPDRDNFIAEKLKRLEVVRVNNTTLINDSANAPLAARFPGAWLLIPLQVQGHVWGSLTLAIENQAYYWQDAEVELLKVIADQLAIAIYQANLLELETQQRQELSVKNAVLEQLYQQAEAATNMKNLFLAYTSHEIRTPISGVIGMTELLAETQLTKSQREFVRTIQVCGKNLLHVINKILDLSKLEAKQLKLEITEFDLVNCIEEVGDVVSLQAHEKNLEIYILIDESVPRCLKGDQDRLQQILTNLTSNAIKFTDSGHVTLRASVVEQTNTSTKIKFAVTDTGIGISEEDRQKLFQPFSQIARATSRKQTGTGLGLALCKQLVELMAGEIGVETNLGTGSSFWFEIALETPQELKTSEIPSANLQTMQALPACKLLVVSESGITREIIKRYAKAWQLQITEADSGVVAMKMLRQAVAENAPYDIAILDMQMSGVSGEVLGYGIRLDQQLSHTQLIIMTFINQQEIGARLVKQGFAARLIKPIKAERLQECLWKAYQALQIPTMTPALEELAIAPTQLPETLPVATPEPSIEEESLSSPESEESETPTAEVSAKPKILIVEDNPINQSLTMMQLKILGYQADCANNGQEALDMLSQKNYSVVLMDCQMPILDGYATTREIRRLEADAQNNTGNALHVTIIAMTASVLEQDKRACFEAGMDDYLSKPILRDHLSNTLNRWLSKC